jgi:hypothetical protein
VAGQQKPPSIKGAGVRALDYSPIDRSGRRCSVGFRFPFLRWLGEARPENAELFELLAAQLRVTLTEVSHRVVEPFADVRRFGADHSTSDDVLEELVAGLLERGRTCGSRGPAVFLFGHLAVLIETERRQAASGLTHWSYRSRGTGSAGTCAYQLCGAEVPCAQNLSNADSYADEGQNQVGKSI